MNKPAISAIALSAVLVAWMLSGSLSEPTVEAPETTKDDVAPMKVRVASSTAQIVEQRLELQGEVEPFRVLQVRAEVDGKIQSLPVELGDRVTDGQLLAKQSLKYRLAQRDEAKALIKQRQSQLKASKKLQHQGLLSDNQLATDEAALASAIAQLEQINYEITNSDITAPFAGIFNERHVELGDYVEKGQALASLVDDLKLKITAMVPQHHVSKLSLGQPVTAELVNGDQIRGELKFVSATSDPGTRSYRIEVWVDNPDHQRWTGMSATLSIPVASVKGHHVSTSVVGLDSEGRLEIKTVNQDSQVEAYPVEIIRTDADSLWVSGLPEQIRLITLGQDFVVAGQTVATQQQGG